MSLPIGFLLFFTGFIGCSGKKCYLTSCTCGAGTKWNLPREDSKECSVIVVGGHASHCPHDETVLFFDSPLVTSGLGLYPQMENLTIPEHQLCKINGSYVDLNCSQQCSCNNDGLLFCLSYECSHNAVCREENTIRKCYCTNGYEGDGETCTPVTFTDCYDVYQAGERQDGVYSILPSGWTGSAFNVPCNMSIDGGGWTVLQRRLNGSQDFELNWNKFKNGFGVLGQELWLGNDKIHVITNQRDYELRMDMVNLDGNAYFAKYNLFRISNEDSKYRLKLGTFDAESTAGNDAMNFHRDQLFSTPDRDNDVHDRVHCADLQRSAWWYSACSHCNLNRPLFGTDSQLGSPYWINLPGNRFLMYTDIKIRPV